MREATLPLRIELLEKAANSRVRYVCELARVLIKRDPYDVVLCGHINLLPLAVDRKSPVGSETGLIDLWDRRVETHWQATKRPLGNVRRFGHFDQPNHQTTVPVLGLFSTTIRSICCRTQFIWSNMGSEKSLTISSSVTGLQARKS